MTLPLTVGSLFSGIGGLDLGLERAGWAVRWQVECDPFCQRVLAQHWPTVPRYGDIRTVDWAQMEPVTLLAGGFPCQDISSAGTRAGLEGARSGLWREFYRAICELRPALVLMENVAALLYRGLGTVLGDLATGGYDAEWSVLSACTLGAPHTRERLFLMAYPHGQLGAARFRLQRCDARRALQAIDHRACQQVWLAALPAPSGSPDGVSSGLDCDRLRGLGNAVVPQVAQWLGERLRAVVEAT